jgi:PAS domain S-box-containing protein
MDGRLSPEAYEELIGHSVDVLTVLDESGRIQYESPSIERVLGYDPEELVGESVFEYVHPDDQQDALETFYEVTEEDSDYTTGAVELRFRHDDGSWVWLESRGSNQTASAIGGYLISSRDISDRKRYEQRLQRERDRLDRFASVVSHDLRNPLSVATGRIELAREDCDSEHLAPVERSLARMDELIDDVLTMTRVGQSAPQLDAVELGELAEDCWQNIDAAEAVLSTATSQTVVADEGQLKQLLENLFRNAVEHGGEDVTVVVGETGDGFYVADDGRGIPDDDRDSLFEAGFSTNADGTGLGLSIANELVQNHDWTIDIVDGEGGGTRVEIHDVTFE